MAFWNKKKAASPAPELNVPLTVMPSQYIAGGQQMQGKKKGGSAAGWIAVAVVVLLFIGASVVAYLYRDTLFPVSVSQGNQNTLNTIVNQPVNTRVNGSNKNVPSTNVNATTTVTNIVVVPQNVNQSANLNVSVNQQNTNTPSAVNQSGANSAIRDTDSDGLTASDEQLWGTNPTFADTDADGFTDAQEILGGYHPTKVQEQLVVGTDVKEYVNAQQGYTVRYPAKMTLRSVDDAGRQVVLTFPQGDMIEITQQQNSSQLSAVAWFQRVNPTASSSEYRRTRIAGADAVITSSGTLAYIPNGSTMLTYVYTPATAGELKYPTSSQYILNSLQLSAPQASSQNGNASTNANVTTPATNEDGI